MALQDKLIDALGRFATTFNSYRYIMAIKSAFITLMPVIIVGAFSVLISNMVLDPKNGLASFSSLSFLAALKPITSALNYATLNFLNIGAVFLIGIELGRINGIKSLFPGLLAVICFICVTPTTVEMMVDGQMHVVKDVLLRQFSDTRSLFLGMFIAILSVEIYCWLEGRKGLKIKMPDTVPPNVSASFSALIPAIITTTEYRYISRMPLRTRSGWFAPRFWETKVEPAFAMEMSGMSVKANSLRAAVWPAMVRVPSPLMPYCSTTEPADTMLLIRPMEMLWLNSSQ